MVTVSKGDYHGTDRDFAVFAVIGQTLNVTLALIIERQTSAFTSIIAFCGDVVVIWVAVLTLWLTKR